MEIVRRTTKSETEVIYDSDNYDIRECMSYKSGQRVIDVVRKIDNRVLFEVPDYTSFIVQCHNEEKALPYFVVAINNELSEYVTYNNVPTIKKIGFIENWCSLDYALIGHSSIRYGKEKDNRWKIYSPFRINPTWEFDHIYDELLDKTKGILLVKKIITYSPNYSDTLYYGIDQDTLDIVTPIYSEFQDRYINIPKVIDEDAGRYEIEKNEMISIQNEVFRYLGLVEEQMKSDKTITINNKPNMTFINSLIK